jgi:hypothetical protein
MVNELFGKKINCENVTISSKLEGRHRKIRTTPVRLWAETSPAPTRMAWEAAGKLPG